MSVSEQWHCAQCIWMSGRQTTVVMVQVRCLKCGDKDFALTSCCTTVLERSLTPRGRTRLAMVPAVYEVVKQISRAEEVRHAEQAEHLQCVATHNLPQVW